MHFQRCFSEKPDEPEEKQEKKLSSLSEMGESEKSEYWATLALRHCKGLGARSQSRLLKIFGNALTALENLSSWKAYGIRQECVGDIRNGKWRPLAKKEWDAALKIKAGILLWNNLNYPAILKDIPDAPILLYARGNIQLLNSPCVALVGSRKASAENRQIAGVLAKSLSDCGLTIVSGMATGIDYESHMGALGGIGKSIGVLGTGISYCYPAINRELFIKMNHEGLLLSEFAPDARPKPVYFPIRNRIISGLSLGTVVVEAAVKSGSVITAQLACEQNREVFAVPGAVYSERSLGCQNLIRQGAHPVFGHEDILRELSQVLKNFDSNLEPGFSGQERQEKINSLPMDKPEFHKKPPSQETEKDEINPFVLEQAKTGEAALILNSLSSGPRHIEQLAQETGLEMNDLSSKLILLELSGKIRRLPGAKFELTK